METEFIDLMMDNGELVKIEYPSEHMDNVLETLDNAIKRRDRWSVNQWDGCRAEYMGISLDTVNTGRVIGVL